MKKIWIGLLSIVLLVGCGRNQNSTPPADSGELEERTYIVGMDDTFAPMGFRNEKGELVGFDVDLAKDAAKRMGISVQFQPIDWSMKETELNAGNIDFIWNGYSITPQREQVVAFSEPYITDKQILVVRADSPYQSKADLAGKIITVQANSSAIDAMNKDIEFVKSLTDDPVEYADNVQCFQDLNNGRADAMVIDEVFGRYYIANNNPAEYRILPEDFGEESYGVGMRKEDKTLLAELNRAFKEQREDGTYDAIFEKWMGEK